jgi:uncharacterized membrane protein YkvA (DUF1232 family)
MRALLRALPDVVRTIARLAADPVLPTAAKVALAAAVLYLVSPVDLIPDFIPVLGYLDDLILIPAGIALLIRLVPAAVMAEMRERAGREFAAGMPKSLAAALVVSAWIAAVGIAAWLVLSRVLPR